MEDGIERSLHSLKERSLEEPDEQTDKNQKKKKHYIYVIQLINFT